MRRQGGRLSIRAYTLPSEEQQSTGRVHIELRDTGPGIPPSVQRRLFEPFVTEAITERGNEPVVPDNGTIQEKGTGLGLYICQDLISAAGGRIDVHSIAAPHADHGAAFHIELPLAEAPPGTPA